MFERPLQPNDFKDQGISGQEIERKWAVQELPNISKGKGEQIVQGYLAVTPNGTEIRLRKKSGKFYQTIKTAGALVRGELEIELTEEQYVAMWPATDGRRLEKTRYSIPWQDKTIELDVYAGALEDLIVAEVEFLSIQEAERFIPPTWFGVEVTKDMRFKNRCLACDGKPMLESSVAWSN